MEATEILLFIFPAIIAILITFTEVKKPKKTEDGKELKPIQRITFFGLLVILLSIATFVLGLKNQTDSQKKDNQHQAKIDTLNDKSDSLRSDLKVVKNQSEMYYQVLQVLGYKLDTTSVEGRRKTDSLLGVILGQKMLLDKKKVYVDLCTFDENLTISKDSDEKYMVKFFLCNFGNTEVYKTKVEYHIIRVNQGKMSIIPKSTRYIHNSEAAFRGDSKVITNFWLMGSTFNTDSIYIYFKGSYENEHKKNYSFKTIVSKKPGQTRFYYVNDDGLAAPKKFLIENNLW